MRAFLFVDCQQDFFGGGALEVPNADEIRPVLQKIMKLAKDEKIPVLKTMDAHNLNDPEFKVFPPHCINGTTGQASIIECSCKKAIIFEKTTYDIFDSPIFEKWLTENKITEVWVAGVSTEICVRAAVLGLCKRGMRVYVFKDAIRGIDERDIKEAVQEMKNAGALFAVAKL